MRRIIVAVLVFCLVLVYPLVKTLTSGINFEDFVIHVLICSLLLAVWSFAGEFDTDERIDAVKSIATGTRYDVQRLEQEIEALREELHEAKEDQEPWRST